MATEYGLRLRAARKYAKMTQIAASKASGIPQSTISTSERESHGSSETPVYAKLYGVDAHWLATGEGEMIPAAVTALNEAVQTPFNAPTVGDALANLGALLQKATPKTRAAVADLLSRYAQDPATGQSLAQAIEILVKADMDDSTAR